MAKIFYRILCATLGLIVGLGADACEYGTTNTKLTRYRLNGQVTAMQTGDPIPGIEVDFQYGEETAFTDSSGRWLINQYAECPNQACRLDISDIDGEANGGQFASKTVNISPEQVTDENIDEYYIFEQSDIDVALDLDTDTDSDTDTADTDTGGDAEAGSNGDADEGSN